MSGTTKQLPPKECALFRSIVKYYEIKQYKKGLKAADAILKKFPDHGETLAMKGLTYNCLNRKEEAYEFVRLGLRNDLKSHVCWHVFGLLYRSDRNYHEAIKCYRNAIRLDPENLQILRDLYLLQIQMRDLKGFAETRRQVLTLKPNNRNNWIGFAIAHHLNGNLQMAIDIIEKYFSTINDGNNNHGHNHEGHNDNCCSGPKLNYEDSEILLYANDILEESGDYVKCLEHLESHQDEIMDTLVFRQRKAQLLVLLERFDEALAVYDELLDINFDNYVYHHGVQCALLKRKDLLLPSKSTGSSSTLFKGKCLALPSRVLDFANEPKGQEMKQILADWYAQQFAKRSALKSTTCLRIPLDFLTGDAFEALADQLLTQQLVMGVPSLGSEVKLLYGTGKETILERLLTKYLPQLAQEKSLDENKPFSPSQLLWTNYFAAQHYDRIGQHAKALEFIEKCIDHTPTVLDFYQRKARILKHTGKLNQAADVMVQGRKLDLADRYINNKATEYLLHADRIEEAEATIALFTRHEGDPQQNLYDMQCMWYELACGKSHLRQKQYGLALKRFFAVEKHFMDFIEDQFDFHTYCIRKMTLRAYVQMLRMCDGIYGHKFFTRAAHGAILCYLELAELQDQANKDSNADLSKMSAAEKKKAKRAAAKARKAEFKRKEEAEELKKQLKQKELQQQQQQQEDSDKKKKQANNLRNKDQVVDKDPLGEELVAKPAMPEAWRFVQVLQQYAGHDVATHLHAFEVALRKQKVVLCLQALVRGKRALEAHDQTFGTSSSANSLSASQRQQFQAKLQQFHQLTSQLPKDSVVAKLVAKQQSQLTF